MRPDGSVFQSVHYNPIGDSHRQNFIVAGRLAKERPGTFRLHEYRSTGTVGLCPHHIKALAPTPHGHEDSVGRLYGFSSAYAETKEPLFLATAQLGSGLCHREPAGGLLCRGTTSDDQGVRCFRNRDSSAAGIIAGGFVPSFPIVTADSTRAKGYREAGERIVQSLIDRYLTPVGDDDQTPPGVLRHGCGVRPSDAMLIYGQYYLLEDLLWLEQHKRDESSNSSVKP